MLPDDLLADVLARLPPRSLAASRCVCKHWCATIDDRRMLRADLLPLRLDGFFLHAAVPCDPDNEDFTRFFSRPSTAHRISADLDLEDTDCNFIKDHCNGLLLLWGLVVNPATRQRVRLPPFPKITTPGMENFYSRFVLAYDPMVSPHYEIVLIPMVPGVESNNNIKLKGSSEWPPSPFTTQVFSSRIWKWEERSFVREGEAVGTVADMRAPG
ncbi:unnamed protein product [Urochloa humidicola]